MALQELRQRLDAIDAQIMALLVQRARIIVQVAALKRQHGLPVHVPEREDAIVERLRTLNPGPLSGEAVEQIYRAIIKEMRNFEHQHIPS